MIAKVFGLADNSAEKQHRFGCSKSKLELYLEILEILAFNSPIKFDLIMQHTDLCYTETLENLNVLVKHNLVEFRKDKYELVYSITDQGGRVARFFRKTTSAFSI